MVGKHDMNQVKPQSIWDLDPERMSGCRFKSSRLFSSLRRWGLKTPRLRSKSQRIHPWLLPDLFLSATWGSPVMQLTIAISSAISLPYSQHWFPNELGQQKATLNPLVIHPWCSLQPRDHHGEFLLGVAAELRGRPWHVENGLLVGQPWKKKTFFIRVL